MKELEEREETLSENGADESGEASLDELLAKKSDTEADAGDSEEETMLATGRDDERVETLSVKVVPQQPTEFVCKKCFLVKHRSQLADRKRMICRDCA